MKTGSAMKTPLFFLDQWAAFAKSECCLEGRPLASPSSTESEAVWGWYVWDWCRWGGSGVVLQALPHQTVAPTECQGLEF